MIIIPSKSIYSLEQSIILNNKINKLQLPVNEISEEVDERILNTARLPSDLNKENFTFTNFKTLPEDKTSIGNDEETKSTFNDFTQTYKLTGDMKQLLGIGGYKLVEHTVNTGSQQFLEISWCELQKLTLDNDINVFIKKSETGIDETGLTDEQIKEEVLKLIKIERTIIAKKITYQLSYEASVKADINKNVTISIPDSTINYLKLSEETVYDIPLGATAPSYTYGSSSEISNIFMTAKGKTSEYKIDIKVESERVSSVDYYKISFPVVYALGVLTYTRGFALTTNVTKNINFIPKLEEYRAESIRIDIIGEFHNLKVEASPLIVETDSDGVSFSLDSNTFIQKPFEERHKSLLQKTMYIYGNGKETIDVLCSVGEYYDTNGEKVISTQTPKKMIFELYDKVIPMYRNQYGEDAPVSIAKNYQSKVFSVLKVEPYFDGAVWQKLQLQEYGEAEIKDGTQSLTYEISEDGSHYICTGLSDTSVVDIVIASNVNGIPVKEILDNAFSGKNIEKVAFSPNSRCETIGANAFTNCSDLTIVEIPPSVKSIGNMAFRNCSSLSEVHIKDIAKWCDIDFASTAANPSYYSEKLFLNGKLIEQLIITDEVNEIKKYTFVYCKTITDVLIPKSVTSIGYMAFAYCTNITSVYYMGSESDWNDINIDTSNRPLTNATRYYYSENQPLSVGNFWHYVNGVPTAWAEWVDPNQPTESEGLEYELTADGTGYSIVGRGTCTDNDVIIPTTHNGLPVKEIGEMAFAYNPQGNDFNLDLYSIVLPDSVTIIRTNAFAYCVRLNKITLPKNLTTIEDNAFFGCFCLVEIYNRSSLNLLDGGAEENGGIAAVSGANIYDDENGTTHIYIEKDYLLYSIVYEGVTRQVMLRYLGNDTYIEIPETDFNADVIVQPHGFVFSGNPNIIKIKLSNFTQSYMCYSTPNLQTVCIPKNIIEFGSYAFEKCNNLDEVYFEGTEAEWQELIDEGIINTVGNESLLNATIYFNSII